TPASPLCWSYICKPVDGSCGTDDGGKFTSPPNGAGLCATGSPLPLHVKERIAPLAEPRVWEQLPNHVRRNVSRMEPARLQTSRAARRAPTTVARALRVQPARPRAVTRAL